ncbi:antibiotic biosynthesis monooxygenase [Streptomyces sp. NBC_00083]|uniref:antibiotic biosynthesis monooxygenase n=1 Tax=Streptomyces sp. NBC_00083 TaxID=2975647 RepID=UPI00225898AB|nr:antibiotic biosynthesis monooxygenase [Streptomyces sp. NBC_00083]MCX5382519.1 antibiotic biosynthesis monooxygenase [Streptomyces sp. NBC_00083]
MSENSPVVAVAHFVLKDKHKAKGAEFEKAYLKYKEAVAAKDGLLRTALLRGIKEPDNFVILTWWRDADAHRTVVGDWQFFTAVSSRFVYLAAITSVHGPVLAGENAADGLGTLAVPSADAAVALTTFTLREGADQQAFEGSFLGHLSFVKGHEGFLGHQLVHSNRETGAYVNIGWWSGPQAYLPVVQSPEMAADAKIMAVHAEVKGGLYKAVVDSARTEVAAV